MHMRCDAEHKSPRPPSNQPKPNPHPHIHIHTTAAVCTGPAPIVSWDALGLAGSLSEGSAVRTWPSSGTTSLPMLASSVGGGQLLLQYADGVPHVKFSRAGMGSYAWFATERPLDLPASAPTLPDSTEGLTMVIVARLGYNLDNSADGGTWEKLFMCGSGAGSNYLSFGRITSSREVHVEYVNGVSGSGHSSVSTTLGDATSGKFEAYIVRLRGVDPINSIYMRGRFATLAWGNERAVLQLPKSMPICQLGRSFPPTWNDIYFGGSLRELSIYTEAFSDERIAAEYERVTAKWHFAAREFTPCVRRRCGAC